MLKGKLGIQGFIIQGHADYAEAGQDIVCAAVSALAQTALLGLEEFLPGQYLWKIRKDGYVECKLRSRINQKLAYEAHIILFTMSLGLEAIKKEYGNYIEIALQEVKEA